MLIVLHLCVYKLPFYVKLKKRHYMTALYHILYTKLVKIKVTNEETIEDLQKHKLPEYRER